MAVYGTSTQLPQRLLLSALHFFYSFVVVTNVPQGMLKELNFTQYNTQSIPLISVKTAGAKTQ